MVEEQTVYETARFYIEEGMYSIEDLKELVYQLEAAKKQQDEMLRKSMEVY